MIKTFGDFLFTLSLTIPLSAILAISLNKYVPLESEELFYAYNSSDNLCQITSPNLHQIFFEIVPEEKQKSSVKSSEKQKLHKGFEKCNCKTKIVEKFLECPGDLFLSGDPLQRISLE